VAHIYYERRDLPDDVRFRHLFEDDPGSAAGEFSPPMDVVESADAVQVILDLPGVAPASIKVFAAQGTIVVAGLKTPARCRHHDAAFHLAERSFGRFLRAVRLTGAVDVGRAAATLAAGVLRIDLPRIEERRGREFRIEVQGS
jgi:HSP20 family protein